MLTASRSKPPASPVALWAGSSPVPSRLEFKRGVQRLKDLNVDFVVAPRTQKNYAKPLSRDLSFLAGPDSEKLQDLWWILKQPKISHVFAVRGGYGGIRLLPGLDKLMGKLPTNMGPKHLWGFSDLTVVQNYLYLKRRWTWFHSPMLTSPSFWTPDPQELTNYLPFFSNAWESFEKDVHHLGGPTLPTSLRKIPLIGGNLVNFRSLMVSRYCPRLPKTFVLFLEDIDENPARRLDRALQELAQLTSMRGCQAVILGHFTNCPGHEGILRAWAHQYQIPVYSKLAIGHEVPNGPLPMGQGIDILKKSKGLLGLRFPKTKLG